MGVGAADGDAVDFSGEDIRGAAAAADPCGATGGKAAIGALGAAVAELEDRRAGGGMADAGGFGGDEGLEIDDVQQGGFDQLGVEDGALDAEDGFVGENGGAFGDGIDVEGQAESGEMVEEIFLKHRVAVFGAQGGEVVDFPGAEVEIPQPFEGWAESGGDGIAALERQSAEEEMEDAFLPGFARLEIGGGHCELVEIGLERRVHVFVRVRIGSLYGRVSRSGGGRSGRGGRGDEHRR